MSDDKNPPRRMMMGCYPQDCSADCPHRFEHLLRHDCSDACKPIPESPTPSKKLVTQQIADVFEELLGPQEPPVTQDDPDERAKAKAFFEAARDESFAAMHERGKTAAEAGAFIPMYVELGAAPKHVQWARLVNVLGVTEESWRNMRNWAWQNSLLIEDALRYYALKEQHEADARIAAVVRKASKYSAYARAYLSDAEKPR